MGKAVEIKLDRDYAVTILGGFYNLKGMDMTQVSINVRNMKVVSRGHTLVTDEEGVAGFVELRLKIAGGSNAVFNFREHPALQATAKTHRRRVIPFILKKKNGQEALDTESFFLTW